MKITLEIDRDKFLNELGKARRADAISGETGNEGELGAMCATLGADITILIQDNGDVAEEIQPDLNRDFNILGIVPTIEVDEEE